MNRLRTKTFLTILPIVTAVVVVSGYLSFLESKTALTQAANRHLAYKAEQLRDFINNEWKVIEDLRMTDNPEYRDAAEASFRSYAYSLLRSDSEQILVLSAPDAVAFTIGGKIETDAEPVRREMILPAEDGWFSKSLFGKDRVGISFSFPPFAWRIAITELRSRYFSEVDGILKTHLWILLASLSAAALLSAAYLRYIIGPLERLTGTIERLTETGDLSIRALAESSDEIGVLADRFNTFIDTIQKQELKLVQTSRAEREAHETAIQREAETLHLLGRISDYNDENTGAHLSRIGTLSELLARLSGLDETEQETIRNSSPLHDIGKIAIPDAILLKPGKLTVEEFSVMKSHTLLGYELLKTCRSRYLAEGAAIALTHHERWDGSGYPNGLNGQAIPLSGRIVSIVDVFDALTSERPYKKAWDRETARGYIWDQRGKQFDPDLAALFDANFSLFTVTN